MSETLETNVPIQVYVHDRKEKVAVKQNVEEEWVVRVAVRNHQVANFQLASIGRILTSMSQIESTVLLSSDAYPNVAVEGYVFSLSMAKTKDARGMYRLRAACNDMNALLKEKAAHPLYNGKLMKLASLNLTTCDERRTQRVFVRAAGDECRSAILEAYKDTFGRIKDVQMCNPLTDFYATFINTAHIAQVPGGAVTGFKRAHRTLNPNLPHYLGESTFNGAKVLATIDSKNFGLFSLNDVTAQLVRLCPSDKTVDFNNCNLCAKLWCSI